MKCKILHESRGRLRVHMIQSRMSFNQADILEFYLRSICGVCDVKVYDRTCDVAITYAGCRSELVAALGAFDYESNKKFLPEYSGRQLNREYEDKLVNALIFRCLNRVILPEPVRVVISAGKSLRYIKAALSAFYQRKLSVDVLDGTAITVSMVRKDYKTASSIMFLLKIGEILEEWTHKKSVNDLARSMSLNVENVWRIEDGKEALTSLNEIKPGDNIVVRTGNMIALDGKVVSGEAMVNQASITGESVPDMKKPGSYAYAGTVVEEGECIICVDKVSGSGRYDKIVKMIEDSEKLKSDTEDKASQLADKLVPYSLGGTILTYLFTRNVTKALSVLMVDFSCALKLSMPIAFLSAMRECSYYNISVKGGKYLESISEADTMVFDKTGTLTHALPTVADVIAFDGNDPDEMLRLAACLEEHYPHSVAKAVIKAAESKNLHHEERHSKVEYVVAHGVSSTVDNEKVIIGSQHFVFQDEGCTIPDYEQEKFDTLPEEYSILYLAIAGRLAAAICIEDPLRTEAAQVVNYLRKLGLSKIVMMTGDNYKTAAAVASKVGVDEFFAEVLPEDKANYVKSEHELGRKVIMIGDGINDSPALSEADVGVAISDGAAIAREIADVTISADDLYTLVTMRTISDLLMKRIKKNYRFIIEFNSVLIALGFGGVLTPATSGLLHNLSTLGISLDSMTNLLD